MRPRLLLLALVVLLCGCVNLHVHFPEANKPAPAEAAK